MQHFATASSLELLRFDYLITGDRHRAEDLLQDALLALNRRFGDGPMRVPNPVAYARRTMTNLNITRSRRSASSEVVVDLFDDLPAPSGSDPADRDLLWQASRRLPVRQRTVRSPASRALAALPGGSRTGLLGRRCAMTDPLELIDRSNVTTSASYRSARTPTGWPCSTTTFTGWTPTRGRRPARYRTTTSPLASPASSPPRLGTWPATNPGSRGQTPTTGRTSLPVRMPPRSRIIPVRSPTP